MKINRLNPHPYYANCYVIGEEGEPCIVIDPGYNDNGYLDKYIDKHHGGKVLGYFITHGHFDHIGGLVTLEHKATLFIHSEDLEFLWEPSLNLSSSFVRGGAIVEPGSFDVYEMSEEDQITIGKYMIEVIHTPFHTKGSVCLYIRNENTLFSGDTLFHLGVGRTDFPGGQQRQMRSSLEKLKKLPPETKVYPGHDKSTTIENELKFNSCLK